LTSTPQFSVDLIAWSAATALVSATTNPNGTVTETWRSSLPVNSTARLYVRVQVE
jgi:hypothetical protein